MRLAEPLRPKAADGILRVVVCARISKETQDPESNVAQQEDAERFVAREYAGPADVHRFSDQGSGWLAVRPGISAAQAAIATGRVDVVLVNELREVYRNPRFAWAFVQDCLDHDARFISVTDNIDTADENWEQMMHLACLRHGMVVPETRRRVRRKATHAFANGGMVMKVKYGYRKLTREEAQSGQFGPKGL